MWKDLKLVKKMDKDFWEYKKEWRNFKKIEKRYLDFGGELYNLGNIDIFFYYCGEVVMFCDEGIFGSVVLFVVNFQYFREVRIVGSFFGFFVFDNGGISV